MRRSRGKTSGRSSFPLDLAGGEGALGDLSHRVSEEGALGGLWSLYVHVPFCLRKCPYCAFPSAPMADAQEGERYLALLEQEISFWHRRWRRLPTLDTIYVGGGTPTVLSPTLWARLTALLDGLFPRIPGAEVTVEANPGTLEREHLELWRRWGVTRVSVGVQSLDDEALATLGRVHSSDQAREALALCVKEGFATSADLMFGLPHQTMTQWHRHLKAVVELGVKHLSVYQLTLEPDTPWGACPPEGLGEGYPFYRFAQWYLPRKGLDQYEVASFSLPGHRPRHNFAYWKHLPVLGLGPGACSYVQGWRFRQEMTLKDHGQRIKSEGSPVAEEERLPHPRRWREFALLALRTGQGVNLRAFRRTFGPEAFARMARDVATFFPDILTVRAGHILLTPRGWRVANRVWGALWNDD